MGMTLSSILLCTGPLPATTCLVCPSQVDNAFLLVSVLIAIGGMALGAVTVLLVEGIVCGICKLRRQRHQKRPTSEEPDNKLAQCVLREM